MFIKLLSSEQFSFLLWLNKKRKSGKSLGSFISTNVSKAYTKNMIFGVTSKKLHMMLHFLGVITHCNNASSNEADIGRWYTGSY